MNILVTRFPYESRLGGAENQTKWLMEGLKQRGHEVSFLGSCPVLLRLFSELNAQSSKLEIGLPPVTKWHAISFLWRKKQMRRELMGALKNFQDPRSKIQAIVMLSLSEKLLLTKSAAELGMKVFWIEHDRVGSWLSQSPWLPALRRAAAHATIVCVSELSRQKYIALGFDLSRVVAIPNGVPLPPPSSPGPFSQREKGKEILKEGSGRTNPDILLFARDMRKNSTSAEAILWEKLRDNQLGVKFRRQHPIDSRIVDFYCHEHLLCIELDGPIHDGEERSVYDKDRQGALEDLGLHVIRFRNEEVLENLDDVLDRIKQIVSPLPSGEGLGVRGEDCREGSGVRVGCIARLSPEKGVDVLIHALADLPDIDLLIVGTGREEGYLRTLAAQDKERLGVARIRFLQEAVDLDAFYGSIDALVLPSSDHDPFGLVAAEAMMRGVPVIVTDACGIAGYLRDGKDALIARAGSPESLQACIERIKDPALRAGLAEEGSKKAHTAFSLESMLQAYESLLSS